MTTITINNRYTLKNPEAYIDAILNCIGEGRVAVDGEPVAGDSLSNLVYNLRYRGFKMPSNNCDQEDVFKALGFSIASRSRAKVGKWTKGGWKYVQPCVAVYL